MRRMVIVLTDAVGDRVTHLGAEILGVASSFDSVVCDVEVARKQRGQLGLQLDIALLRTEAALYQTISSSPERYRYNSQLHSCNDS